MGKYHLCPTWTGLSDQYPVKWKVNLIHIPKIISLLCRLQSNMHVCIFYVKKCTVVCSIVFAQLHWNLFHAPFFVHVKKKRKKCRNKKNGCILKWLANLCNQFHFFFIFCSILENNRNMLVLSTFSFYFWCFNIWFLIGMFSKKCW